ncbi:thioredoxin family protein [Fictibacillus phosphorivorans]|uniref:thioredoxin family protein n=1 Tax=Fictibacillus phosphorivorans TaxID=1221500 RepID=UPI00203AF1AA|nr:thioredoxin family protein [Fictibacillus phosphorivorans]MCM3717977.1 thioredoxin family protein [Fictibacillus phosphorivorans]MCM3775426.1 thioredoxin family protein [Fictibacillus phosphorivorans]
MEHIKSIEQFREQIKSGVTVAVFSADWCPDCVVIKPILPEIEKEYPHYPFVYVDRDELIELCQELDIFGIPSFVAFKDGQEISRYVNKERKTKEQITAFLNELNILNK